MAQSDRRKFRSMLDPIIADYRDIEWIWLSELYPDCSAIVLDGNECQAEFIFNEYDKLLKVNVVNLILDE